MTNPIRVPTLWILVPFAAGICTTSLFHLSALPCLLAAIALATVSLLPIGKKKPIWRAALLAALIIAGHAFALLRLPSLPSPEETLPPREAEFTLKIERSFGYNPDYQSLSGLAVIVAAPVHLQAFQGQKVYYSLRTSDTALRPEGGYTIAAIGVAQALPRGQEVQAFHHYLYYRGVSTLYTRGDLKSIIATPNPRVAFFQNARNWIQEKLSRNVLPESDYTRAYLGMMLGLKSELSPEQKDLFLKNGTMHLFAISGLHIGIVAACIHCLLLLARFPKAYVPYLALVSIACFVILTGGMASAWRAFIMIACVYLGNAYKRQSYPLSALSLSALICLLIDPLQLFLASFQMSYATVAAILLFGVPLADRYSEKWQPFKSLPRPAWGPAHRAIASLTRFTVSGFWVSLAAFLTSSLFGILYFNTFPTLGIFINLLLLPIASLAIIAGFCSVLVALLQLSAVSFLFNNAAILLIAFIHKTLELLSKLSWASIETNHTSGRFLILASIGLLVFLAFGYDRRWKIRPALLFIPPCLIFAIGIALQAS